MTKKINIKLLVSIIFLTLFIVYVIIDRIKINSIVEHGSTTIGYVYAAGSKNYNLCYTVDDHIFKIRKSNSWNFIKGDYAIVAYDKFNPKYYSVSKMPQFRNDSLKSIKFYLSMAVDRD